MTKAAKRQDGKSKNRHKKAAFAKLRRWVLGLFILTIVIMPRMDSFAEEVMVWHKSSGGIDESKITAICVIKDMPRVIFAGGGRAIYKTVNQGASWYRIFMLKGERSGINFIAYDESNSYKIYAATNDGLHVSLDGGKNWQRSFRGKDSLQREVRSIAIDKDNPACIYIGTKKGLFQSNNGGKNWQGMESFINKEISSIAMDNGNVYISAIDGVYVKEGSGMWERIYVARPAEEEDANANGDNGDKDEEEKVMGLNHIRVYEENVYLATDKGLFVSERKEKEWKLMNSEGLLTKKIRFVLPTDKCIFAATLKGVFFYDGKNKRWNGGSLGLATLAVNALDSSGEDGLIFAVCDDGVYKAKLDNNQEQGQPSANYDIDTMIGKEPVISDIQQAAIEYAEVSPKKIEWMRNAAKNKAWLPEVSIGLDGDVDRSLDIDRGGTSDRDFYIEGPKEKGWGWDVSAAWNLGELIYSDDQTNIDVRSRLMVQLRNDVLDEVTKLYFERRRLQLELYANPPKDEAEKALKQLRYEELTASIDALTDGYLSKSIKDGGN